MKTSTFFGLLVTCASSIASAAECNQNSCYERLQNKHGNDYVLKLCGPFLGGLASSSNGRKHSVSSIVLPALNGCESTVAMASAVCKCAEDTSISDIFSVAEVRSESHYPDLSRRVSSRDSGSLEWLKGTSDLELSFKYTTDEPNNDNVIRLYRDESVQNTPVASLPATESKGVAKIDARALLPGSFKSYLYSQRNNVLAGPTSVSIDYSLLKLQGNSKGPVFEFAYKTSRSEDDNIIAVYKRGKESEGMVTKQPAPGSIGVLRLSADLLPGEYTAYLTRSSGIGEALSQGIQFAVDAGNLSLDKSRVRYTFRYTTEFPSTSNWIGIYPAEKPEDGYVSSAWEYAPGGAGTVTIDVNLRPGNYTAFFTTRAGLSEKLADGLPVAAAEGKLQLHHSHRFTFEYETAVPHGGNYIGIFDADNRDAPGSGLIEYAYAGEAAGTVRINSPTLTPDRTYRAFFLQASSQRVLGKELLADAVTFRPPRSQLSFIKDVELVTFDYQAVTPSEWNWIALFDANDNLAPANENYKSFNWAPGETATTQLNIFDVAPGKYKAYMLADGGYTPLSSATRVTIPPNTVVYSKCKKAWTIEYTTTWPKASNWVALYPGNYDKAPSSQYIAYQYAPDKQGEAYFNILDEVKEGNYTIFYLANGGYDVLAGPVKVQFSTKYINSPTCKSPLDK